MEHLLTLADEGVVGLLVFACVSLWTFLQKQTFKIQEQLFKQLDAADAERREEIQKLLNIARSIESSIKKDDD